MATGLRINRFDVIQNVLSESGVLNNWDPKKTPMQFVKIYSFRMFMLLLKYISVVFMKM